MSPTKGAYYNEIDKGAAAWLRELIKAGLIADGDVDERSIAEVRPDDLKRYTQCHFFAGIGGWSYALRLAGWPDDQPVWTGSCPCQPFSVAGKGRGTADERHLWPEFARLIAECSPSTVFGEQVASKAGREWLAGVRLDLEGMGYAVGAADLCAAGVGAPHIRQRLYWVADRTMQGLERPAGAELQRRGNGLASHGATGGVADSERQQEHEEQRGPAEDERGRGTNCPGGCCVAGGMGDANLARSQGRSERPFKHADQRTPWASGVALDCTDGKSRRIEPGAFPLAHGIPARMGRLRGYGNAIVPQVAATFITASREALREQID